jgi:lysophospholipase L1-like esterase
MRTSTVFLAFTLLACTSGTQSRATSPGGAGGEAGSGAAPASGNGGAPTSDELPVCPDPIDLGVHLVGRYDGCDEAGVRMSWSGTGFVARFNGTGLEFTVDGSVNYYTVRVDGVLGDPLVTTDGAATYPLAADLDSGEHVVEVYRRTEASQGAVLITGIEVTDGELLAPPDPPTRRIEIVGDSITCGYGNEGPDTSCSFTPDTENHYLSYGARLARHFEAELSTVAWSGKGVVSNYNGDLFNPLPTLYERAVPNDSQSGWAFEWQPQVVIINLGTNDYSTNNDPTDEDFVAGYEALLRTIRRRYPDAFILCTVGPMLSGRDLSTAQNNIAAAVALRNDAGDERVTTHEMATGNPDPACDWHPNLDTHAAMAEELATPLADALGW